MTIPDFETLMNPMLIYASDEQEHSYRDTIEFLADGYVRLYGHNERDLCPN